MLNPRIASAAAPDWRAPIQPWPHALGGKRALAGLLLCLALPLGLGYGSQWVPWARAYPLLVVSFGTTAVTLVYLALVRTFEWRRVVELGLRPLPRELGLGLLLGGVGCAGIIAGNYALVAWLGATEAGAVTADAALRAFVLSRGSAVIEEIAFRGLVLRWLLSRAHVDRAVALQALAFGIVHYPQGGIPHVVFATIMGLVFGYAFAWRHSLWTPIGIHFAWDVAALLPSPVIPDEMSGDLLFGWLILVAVSLAWLLRHWALQWGTAARPAGAVGS